MIRMSRILLSGLLSYYGLAACKRLDTTQSDTQSLESLATKSTNQCEAGSYKLSSLAEGRILPANHPEKAHVISLLKAIPTELQDEFFKKGRIEIADTKEKCGANGSGTHDISSCRKNEKDGYTVYLRNDAAAIQHGTIRAVAIMLAEVYFSGKVIDDLLGEENGNIKERIAKAYLNDVARLERAELNRGETNRRFSLAAFKPLLPEEAQGALSLDASAADRSNILDGVKHLKFVRVPAEDVNIMKRDAFYNLVFAETLDSVLCNPKQAATLDTDSGLFKDTGAIFNPVASRLIPGYRNAPTTLVAGNNFYTKMSSVSDKAYDDYYSALENAYLPPSEFANRSRSNEPIGFALDGWGQATYGTSPAYFYTGTYNTGGQAYNYFQPYNATTFQQTYSAASPLVTNGVTARGYQVGGTNYATSYTGYAGQAANAGYYWNGNSYTWNNGSGWTNNYASFTNGKWYTSAGGTSWTPQT